MVKMEHATLQWLSDPESCREAGQAIEKKSQCYDFIVIFRLRYKPGSADALFR